MDIRRPSLSIRALTRASLDSELARGFNLIRAQSRVVKLARPSPRSDGARWINGANLPVDGGLEASINATVLGF